MLEGARRGDGAGAPVGRGLPPHPRVPGRAPHLEPGRSTGRWAGADAGRGDRHAARARRRPRSFGRAGPRRGGGGRAAGTASCLLPWRFADRLALASAGSAGVCDEGVRRGRARHHAPARGGARHRRTREIASPATGAPAGTAATTAAPRDRACRPPARLRAGYHVPARGRAERPAARGLVRGRGPAARAAVAPGGHRGGRGAAGAQPLAAWPREQPAPCGSAADRASRPCSLGARGAAGGAAGSGADRFLCRPAGPC